MAATCCQAGYQQQPVHHTPLPYPTYLAQQAEGNHPELAVILDAAHRQTTTTTCSRTYAAGAMGPISQRPCACWR
jgi:hypothetical protein